LVEQERLEELIDRLGPKFRMCAGDADEPMDVVLVGEAVLAGLARDQLPADLKEPSCLLLGGDQRQLPEGHRPLLAVWKSSPTYRWSVLVWWVTEL
jgi:hypothetical protein